MAKKKKIKKNSKSAVVAENALPQNILPIGERVEENKNIYISQPVYKEIHKFTKNKTTNESGGMLIGDVIEEFGKTNIIIKGFIEAKHCDATPTTLKFTHETWEYVHKEIDKKFPGQKIVGWIHTHPNFGIFLSEYDKFIQENFFKEDYQIAYVVDPIQEIEGFYFWINGNIERCKGYYLFDKMGAKIEATAEPEEEEEEKTSGFGFKGLLIAILFVCVVLLGFSNMNLNKKVQKLMQQQQDIIIALNQTIYQQQSIAELQKKIDDLEKQLGLTTEQTDEKVEESENSDAAETDTDTPADQKSEEKPAEEDAPAEENGGNTEATKNE